MDKRRAVQILVLKQEIRVNKLEIVVMTLCVWTEYAQVFAMIVMSVVVSAVRQSNFSLKYMVCAPQRLSVNPIPLR